MAGLRTSTTHYDAFISYSHAKERVLAEALQSELQRFARPWYKPRALRIFRDTTNLAATPELWPSIVDALGRSEWFILMASPHSAKSRWVADEIKWWTANRSQDRILIALAGGSIVWDRAARDFDWSRTDAIPSDARRLFKHEPLYIDLRNTPRSGTDEPGRPRLGDLVAEFAAPIRGVDKDTLVGEHVELERRTKRILRSIIATLTTLLVAVSAATVFAVVQRNEAREQSRIAMARQLAATAISLTTSRMDLAQLFAVQAHRMHDDQQTRAALFRAVTASPALVRYLPAGGQVEAVGGSADGRVVVAGTTEGRVVRWSVAGGPSAVVAELGEAVRSVAVTADGSTVVAAGETKVVRWTGARAETLQLSTKVNGAVAVSPSGRFVALAEGVKGEVEGGWTAFEFALLDTRSGRTVKHTLGYPAAQLEFETDSVLVSLSPDGRWDRLSTPALTSLFRSEETPLAVWGTETTLSGGGSWFTYSQGDGRVQLWSTARRPTGDRPDLYALSHGTDEQALAVSPDGNRVAVADAGTIYISRTGTGDTPADAQLVLSGGGAVRSGGLRFLGDNTHLVSAVGDSLVLWDIGQLPRIGSGSRVNVPVACHGCQPPAMSISPDGLWAAIAGREGNGLITVDTTTGQTRKVNDGNHFDLIDWSDDGRTLFVEYGGVVEARSTQNPERVLRSFPKSDGNTVLAMSADQKQTMVLKENRFEVHDTATGQVIRTLAQMPAGEKVYSQMISRDNRTLAVRLKSDDLTRTRALIIRDGQVQVIPGMDVVDIALGDDELLTQRATGMLEAWKLGDNSPYRSIDQDSSFVPTGGRSSSRPAIKGSLIAQRRLDGAIVVTDASTGQQFGTLDLPVGTAASRTTFAFLPNASDLLSVTEGNENGLYIRWMLSPDGWSTTACRTAARDISDAEWQAYAGTVTRPEHICDPASTAPETVAAKRAAKSQAPASAAVPATQSALATDMEGSNPAYLTAVDPARGSVIVDRIEFDNGLIVNKNPLLRTLQIADPIRLTTNSGPGTEPVTASVPLADLASLLAYHPAAAEGRLSTDPYQLTVQNRRVTAIAQIS